MVLEPVLSINSVFPPPRWSTGELIPLFAENGELLYYAMGPSRSWRESLPIEFFHHQLKELDIRNPPRVAVFMSEYGTLGLEAGASSFGREDLAWSLIRFRSSLLPADADFVRMELMQSGAEEDALSWIFSSIGPHIDYAIRTQFIPFVAQWEDAGMGGAFESAYPLPDGLGGCVRAVTPLQVEKAYLDLMVASIVSDELVSSSGSLVRKTEELYGRAEAPYLHGSDYVPIVEYGLEVLNRLLSGSADRVGYVAEGSGAPVFPGAERETGSLECAVARQIKEFIYRSKEDGYFVCSECGQVFARKQPAREGARARRPSDGTKRFCCERCKNAQHARKHRQSPGYKMKRDAKKKGSRTG